MPMATEWKTAGSSRASRRDRDAPDPGGAAIAGLFMMLVLAFGRARDALLIMLNLPLALIGGVAGVFLAGGVLSVASIIGFITLFGIATRNGIMLVSHRHLLEVEGVASFREAVERGAHERLIPIVMTAMAAGLALIPLAMRGGESGSEIQTPMAIVICRAHHLDAAQHDRRAHVVFEVRARSGSAGHYAELSFRLLRFSRSRSRSG